MAFILLLVAVPVAVIGLVLPINEYSWMANDGSVPPDCDIVTGMLLFPTGIAFLAGFLGFGLLFLRRRSKLPLIGAAISALRLFGIGLKLPQYIQESDRAAQLCPK